MAGSAQQTLLSSGLDSELEAGSEIRNMIEAQLQNFVAENTASEQTQKTNLEDESLVELQQTVSSIEDVNTPQFLTIMINNYILLNRPA